VNEQKVSPNGAAENLITFLKKHNIEYDERYVFG